MRDKKRFISAILITTVMLFVSGCDKQAEPVSAERAETAKEADTEESTEESLEPTPSPTALSKESVKRSEAPDNAEKEVDTTEEESQTSPGSGSGSGSNSGGSTGGTRNSETSNTESTETTAPAHEHTWKEHTVTNQVWVSNIVVVDDYEYRVVGHVDAVAVCNCGYTTTDSSAMESHVMNHVLAGENTQFTVREGHDIVEEVKVGSHEEDKGHYETQTYVDYYYCDCGATK